MTDPDLDLLRLEAQTAQTHTRRTWAQRLVERIETLETNRDNLTRSYTYSRTATHDDSQESEDPDPGTARPVS